MNRTRILVLLVVAAIAQTAPGLTAQERAYQATVPFQFSAGNKTLPAGEYRISRRNAFVFIENENNATSAMILSSTAEPSGDGQIHLVFDEVSDQHFLRRVVAPESLGSIELGVSGAEKRAETAGRRLLAANPPAGPVTVAFATGR